MLVNHWHHSLSFSLFCCSVLSRSGNNTQRIRFDTLFTFDYLENGRDKISSNVTSAKSKTNGLLFQLVLVASSLMPTLRFSLLFFFSYSHRLVKKRRERTIDWSAIENIKDAQLLQLIIRRLPVVNTVRLKFKNKNMDETTTSFVQIHRDDSGYGSPLLHQDYSSPQPSNSTYYSYAHSYHPHLTGYANSSFHLYDTVSGSSNIYNGGSSNFSLNNRLEQGTSDLSVCSNQETKPSKDLLDLNACPPYDFKINWGKK